MGANTQPARDRYAIMSHTTAWLLIFAVFTAIGCLTFAYRYLDDLARNVNHTFSRHLFEEMTGVYTAFVLFPAVLWIVRRIRIRRRNWWRTVPLNLLTMVGFSVCHTTLMHVTRSILSPLLGLGTYNYGNMLYRYPMEFAQHVIFFSMAVGAIYVADSYRESRNQQIATAEVEARLAEAQLQNLRLQLQPHFLFNALNTISSVMHEDVDRADAMLAQLSDLLRRTLRAANSQEVPLEEELALLKSYLSIMEARFGDELHVNFTIDPSLSSALVPQLILQPLVENSIRHARETESARLDIKVCARREHENLLLQVSDNGPGIPNLDTGEWQKGLGLSNTEERLEGLYGPDHQFVLENSNGSGLTVTVRLPLRIAAAAAK